MSDMPPASRAILGANKGNTVIELFPSRAPKIVKNFVELTAGMREWVNPNTGTETNQPTMTVVELTRNNPIATQGFTQLVQIYPKSVLLVWSGESRGTNW